jgi:hypothetical protein
MYELYRDASEIHTIIIPNISFVFRRFILVIFRDFPAMLFHGFFEDEFDLAVYAAQFLLCPSLNGVVELGIDANQEWFARFHMVQMRSFVASLFRAL